MRIALLDPSYPGPEIRCAREVALDQAGRDADRAQQYGHRRGVVLAVAGAESGEALDDPDVGAIEAGDVGLVGEVVAVAQVADHGIGDVVGRLAARLGQDGLQDQGRVGAHRVHGQRRVQVHDLLRVVAAGHAQPVLRDPALDGVAEDRQVGDDGVRRVGRRTTDRRQVAGIADELHLDRPVHGGRRVGREDERAGAGRRDGHGQLATAGRVHLVAGLRQQTLERLAGLRPGLARPPAVELEAIVGRRGPVGDVALAGRDRDRERRAVVGRPEPADRRRRAE